MKPTSIQNAHAPEAPGQTRGYHVTAWGVLVEMLAENEPIGIAANGHWLHEVDAEYYGKRTVWPAILMQMAFAYLVSHGLVAVRLRDGQAFASINYERLVARLRNEQQYLIANPADTATCRALSYFRSRRLLTKSPWLDRLMADVNGVEAEPVEDRRAVSTPETSPAPLRTRGPHGTAGGAPEHA